MSYDYQLTLEGQEKIEEINKKTRAIITNSRYSQTKLQLANKANTIEYQKLVNLTKVLLTQLSILEQLELGKTVSEQQIQQASIQLEDVTLPLALVVSKYLVKARRQSSQFSPIFQEMMQNNFSPKYAAIKQIRHSAHQGKENDPPTLQNTRSPQRLAR